MNSDPDRDPLRFALAAALGLAACFVAPRALATALESQALSIEATSALGGATLHVSAAELSWDATGQRLFWSTTSRALVDAQSGATVATITLASFTLRSCSRIDLSLSVDAGAADTVITVRTGRLSFETIAAADAVGRATASLSISDRNNNGATLAGVGAPGTPVYRAWVNGGAAGGTLFSGLVGALSAGAGGNASAYQTDPQTGFRFVGAPVGDAAVELVFSLSAGDRGTASTMFDVDPNPAGCAADRDADGRPDWLDACPDDAAKTEPGGCGCGHPDTDRDADGVLDCNDNCPDQANVEQSDADADGAGDACDATPNGDGSQDDAGDDDHPTGGDAGDDSEADDAPTGDNAPREDSSGDAAGDDPVGDDDPDVPDSDPAGDDRHAGDPPDESGEPHPPGGASDDPRGDRADSPADERDPDATFAPLAFSPCGLGSAYLAPVAILGLATAPTRRRARRL